MTEPGIDNLTLPLQFAVRTGDGQDIPLTVTIVAGIEFADLFQMTFNLSADSISPPELSQKLSGLPELKDLIAGECATHQAAQLNDPAATAAIINAIAGALSENLKAKGLNLIQIAGLGIGGGPAAAPDEPAGGNIYLLLDDAAAMGLMSVAEVTEFKQAVDPADIGPELEVSLGDLREKLEEKHREAAISSDGGEVAEAASTRLREWLLAEIAALEDADTGESAPEAPLPEPSSDAAGKGRRRLSRNAVLILAACFVMAISCACFTYYFLTDTPAEYLMLAEPAPERGGQIQPGFGSYEEGETVPLEALPAPGYRFVSWSGDITGNNPEVRVNIERDMLITANFEALHQYELKLTHNPVAAGTVSPGGGIYAPGEPVILSAAAASGYEFSHWSGDLSGDTPEITVVMNGDQQIVANFIPTYYDLNIHLKPSAIAGEITTTGGSYQYGSKVDVQALVKDGYRFDGWSGDISGTNPEIEITVNRDMRVYANFALESYRLESSISPEGGGSIQPVSGSFDHGSFVNITAIPFAGYSFYRWSGDASGNEPAIRIRLDSDKTITAHFVSRTCRLNTSVNPSGTVGVSPRETSYQYGSAVTLTAQPTAGHRFHYWDGDASGSSPKIIITMDADKTITANFEAMTSILKYTMLPNTGGQSWVTYQRKMNAGETIALTANISGTYYAADTNYGWGIIVKNSEGHTVYNWAGTRVDDPGHDLELTAGATVTYTVKVYHWSAYQKSLEILIRPSDWALAAHLP